MKIWVLLALSSCVPKADVVSWGTLSRSHWLVQPHVDTAWHREGFVGGESMDVYRFVLPDGCWTLSVSGDDGLVVDVADEVATPLAEGSWRFLSPDPWDGSEGMRRVEVMAHPSAAYQVRLTPCEQ